MRFDSSVWLMLVLSLLVVWESVSSLPIDDVDELALSTTGRPSGRKHSKINSKLNKKKKHTKSVAGHRHHSTRGLKQVTDYDYTSVAEPTAAKATSPVQRNNKKTKDDRSQTNKRRNNKKSNKKNNNNNKKKKSGRQNNRQVVRTARRAGAFTEDDETVGQLLGLGKPRPVLPPAQLKPFVSVGVFGDMRKFFDELRSNLDVDSATAEAAVREAESLRDPKQRNSSPAADDLSQITGLEDYEELPNYQALRTTTGSEGITSPIQQQQQRRYSRLRGFVAMGGSQSESSRHHRNHPYDPALLWTGLGRRR